MNWDGDDAPDIFCIIDIHVSSANVFLLTSFSIHDTPSVF